MNRKTIVVVGTLASDPYAGMAWMHMQIVLGLQKLGHDVYYFEITSNWPYNPDLGYRTDNADYAVLYLAQVADSFGLRDRWAFRCSFAENKEWIGISKTKAEDLLANADLVFNVSGATRIGEEGIKVGRLVYFGTDPVYHEIKYAQGDEDTKSIVDEHHDVVTYGENIGRSDCPIPPLPNLRARTRQPIVTELWQGAQAPTRGFTTVGNWKQAGRDLQFRGETYHWSKHYEFLKFIDAPRRVGEPIEVATNLVAGVENVGEVAEVQSVKIVNQEYNLLTSNGWKLVDGPAFTQNPWPYREYILSSRGEFTFAKDQNIRLRSGWFSERSACYLAAGRPVITQDTAFGCALPTGEGLFAFNSMSEIESAFDAINSDYERHSRAAREIAEEYFKAEGVMERLLNALCV